MLITKITKSHLALCIELKCFKFKLQFQNVLIHVIMQIIVVSESYVYWAVHHLDR